MPDTRNSDEDAPKTVSERAYRAIRSDIVWGALKPGAPLRSDELRRKYDVGISPLREALSRLASERLVTASGQRGFRVAPMDRGDIVDISDTRLVIECAALRRSIARGDVDWETRVVATHHALSRVPVPREQGAAAETWTARHREFHMALLSACGSDWLQHLAAQFFDQAERFRILRAMRDVGAGSVRDPAEEHKAIVEAALARDADGAETALRTHYRTTTDLALANLEDTEADADAEA